MRKVKQALTRRTTIDKVSMGCVSLLLSLCLSGADETEFCNSIARRYFCERNKRATFKVKSGVGDKGNRFFDCFPDGICCRNQRFDLVPRTMVGSLALFLMATLFGLFTYFLCRYLKKKIDRMEKEVAETEKLIGDEEVEEDD